MPRSIICPATRSFASAMSVSNQATAADQVRAGVAGGLLGIGAIPGVNGQGIGVAIVDSGISPHAALANKVVANVSLITGDPSVADAFGHGTHVAGIIAGNRTAAHERSPALFNGGIAPGVQLSTCACSAPTASAGPATSSPASSGRSRTARSTTSAS